MATDRAPPHGGSVVARLRAVTILVTDTTALVWEEFDAKARAAEPPYEAAALGQFTAEADAVVRMLERNVPATKATLQDLITNSLVWPYIEAAMLLVAAAYGTGGTFYRQWYNRFRPIIAKTMATPAPSVRIGILGPTSPQVVTAINRRVTKLAGGVTQTTAQQIRDVVAQARIDGVGVSELASRIRSQVFADTITTTRATTIARTETVGALNEAAWVKARQSGVMRAKRWIDQRDGKVRPTHRTAAGDGWIPIDQPHSNGLQYPHEPGAPADEVIQCRCSEKFTDLTADEANRSG